MAFDGCGVTNGCTGTLFAAGLKKQCQVVVNRIIELLATGDKSVRVNVLGLSRGGIAAMYLAQMLSDERVSCSQVLYFVLSLLKSLPQHSPTI